MKRLRHKERIIGPLDFHDRHNLTIPPHLSILQHQLEDLARYTRDHHMVLNSKKTKCLPFLKSKVNDFMPQLKIEGEDYLEVIYSLKLVGLVVTSGVNWHEHVDYTVKRVNKVLWQLTRFKQYGAPEEKLVKFYVLKIRSILMFGAVCYHSSISLELSQRLELQQKRSFAIILGPKYSGYKGACDSLNLPRIDKLRDLASLKWAMKAKDNSKHSHLFPLNKCPVETRNKKKFSEYSCKSAKYFNSAVPYMTRLLNSHYEKREDKITITTNSGLVITV